MNERLSVLYASHWYMPYSVGLVNELSKQHNVRLISTNLSLNQLGENWREMIDPNVSVRVENDTKPRTQQPASYYFSSYRELMKDVEMFKPDVVHFQETNDPFLMMVFLLFLSRTKLPFVLTVHDPLPHLGDKLKYYRLRRPLLDKLRLKADNIITLAEHNKKELLSIYPKLPPIKVSVVLHGVMNYYLRWKKPEYQEQENNILFFGRMQEYKGLSVLLKAWAIIKEKHTTAKLVMAGSGPDLEKYLPELRKDERIILINRFIESEEAARLMCEASVVVLPYIEATQSGVLAISSAFAKPTILTTVGGMPEMVTSDESALLIPPNNADALAEATLLVLNSKTLRSTLAEGAKKLSLTSLSWSYLATKVVDVYKEVIAEKKKDAVKT